MRHRRIGIDFDNTIADYDHVFNEVAREWGLVADGFEGGKGAVRQAVSRLKDGEYHWQRLQGRVYGKYMARARLIDGVASFFRHVGRVGGELFIVSHKTRFGHHDPERIDLRDAARAWMDARGFFRKDGLGMAPEALFFEETREAKVARIAELSCDCFIDDLFEVLFHPRFPHGVERYLFDPGRIGGTLVGVHVCQDWAAIEHAVLSDEA